MKAGWTSEILQKGTIELSSCSPGYLSKKRQNDLKVNSEIIRDVPPTAGQGFDGSLVSEVGPLFGSSVPGGHSREQCGQLHTAMGMMMPL